MLKIEDACPIFELPNQFGETIKISELLGKKILVIFFYPKDNTSGCTLEACAFRDNYAEFQDLNCEIIGISSDNEDRHLAFSTKYLLNYTLLADSNKKARKAFEVPTNLFGLIPGRVTYVIGLDKKIKAIYNSQTNPFGHIQNALEIVKVLKSDS